MLSKVAEITQQGFDLCWPHAVQVEPHANGASGMHSAVTSLSKFRPAPEKSPGSKLFKHFRSCLTEEAHAERNMQWALESLDWYPNAKDYALFIGFSIMHKQQNAITGGSELCTIF